MSKSIEDRKGELAFKKTVRSLTDICPVHLMTWQELHSTRSTLQKELENMLDRSLEEKRNLNETEESAYQYGDELLGDIQSEFEKRDKHNTKDPVDLSSRLYRPSLQTDTDMPILTNSKTYRGMFYGSENAGLDKAGFDTMNEFFDVMSQRVYDPRLEKRTFVSKDGPSGGYAVPEEWAGLLLDKALEDEIVRPRAVTYPMLSGTKHIPAWDLSDHQNDGMFGFTAEWLGENASGTVQTGKMRSITLNAEKLAIYTEASREVLADGLDFANQIGSALIRAMSFYLDSAFLTGSGVGRPKGILLDPAAVSVTRAGANAVAYADLYGMYARMHPACHSTAVWVMNHAVLPQLMAMTVNPDCPLEMGREVSGKVKRL
jgi:HK97 family phage major capsid protein